MHRAPQRAEVAAVRAQAQPRQRRHHQRENRPVQAYLKWANRIPGIYARTVLEQPAPVHAADVDLNQLAMIKHFKSLMPMAQESRKPMFHLTAADGAIGGHAGAVQDCGNQFRQLARKILDKITAGSG